jgi:hypothetical protein
MNSTDNRPRSVLECVRPDGALDARKFAAYQQRQGDETLARLRAAVERVDEAAEVPPSRKRSRSSIGGLSYVEIETGHTVKLEPTESTWYKLYVSGRPAEAHGLAKFRRRFRLPYDKYLELVADAKAQGWFPRAGKADALGKVGAPLELLILGALRYLGRGWTFDDLEESTAISAESHRVFLHDFVKIGATVLFEKYVVMPTTRDLAETCMREYEEAGMPGALGSGDATHITMEKCSARLKNSHMGGKSTFPTVAFNMTVNHRRRILHTSPGLPGRWNDKTLQLFDDLFRGIEDGSILGVGSVAHFLCVFLNALTLAFMDVSRTLNLSCTKMGPTGLWPFGTAASGFSWTTATWSTARCSRP